MPQEERRRLGIVADFVRLSLYLHEKGNCCFQLSCGVTYMSAKFVFVVTESKWQTDIKLARLAPWQLRKLGCSHTEILSDIGSTLAPRSDVFWRS